MHTFLKTDKKNIQSNLSHSSPKGFFREGNLFREFKYYSISSNSIKSQPDQANDEQNTLNANGVGSPTVSKKVSFVNIRFIGVGFRGYIATKKQSSISPEINGDSSKKLNRFITSESDVRFLMLKVGQSALTAYPIPANIEVFCPKDQQADKQAILLIGENLQELKQVVAEIKSYKKPDPYKGSGIYETQRIETEEGEIFKDEIVFRKVMKKK